MARKIVEKAPSEAMAFFGYFKGHNHVKPETVNFNYIKIHLLTNNNNKVNKQTNKTFKRSNVTSVLSQPNCACGMSDVNIYKTFYGKMKL